MQNGNEIKKNTNTQIRRHANVVFSTESLKHSERREDEVKKKTSFDS